MIAKAISTAKAKRRYKKMQKESANQTNSAEDTNKNNEPKKEESVEPTVVKVETDSKIDSLENEKQTNNNEKSKEESNVEINKEESNDNVETVITDLPINNSQNKETVEVKTNNSFDASSLENDVTVDVSHIEETVNTPKVDVTFESTKVEENKEEKEEEKKSSKPKVEE